MAFEFELPDVGEGIAEGEIVEWHVSAGDRVEEDQVMADVETDKAVVDLPAPVTGTVLELHAGEGEMVPVGTVVATIEVEGEVPDEEVEETAEPADEAAESAEEPADAAGDATDGSTPADDGEAVEAATGDGRVFAPPNVRRLARELGVDITAVDGSGPGGRITEGDVRTTAESGGADDAGDDGDAPKSAVTRVSDEEGDGTGAAGGGATASGATAGGGAATTATVETADREQTLATPATRNLADELDVDLDEVPTEKTRDGEAYVEEADVRAFAEAREAAEAAEPAAGGAGGAAAPQSASAAATGERETREAYTGIRRTIGQQMEKSAFTAPRAAHYDQADVSALVETRERLKARAEEQGIKLTYMPFIIRAIIAALKEYPELNTELDEDTEEIIYKHYYNIGIAVATDAGLMVPVLKDADKKGMLQIASEVNELASKARERKVSPQEMQGGTFTITNFGAFGGEYALPIINHPETAILGLGSIEQRPVVEEGETTESSRNASDTAASTGEVVARHTLPLSVAIDHRVIDGAEAAQFCNTVIEYLENPELLLLE
ncbi:MAG: branched-chain alpha-keto acid dehydrogenase subunit E2 [Halobacteriales archaeon SW_8_66_22]|nr:MAG: branched-chain alpha-keto acid dehydrogenase subunit E2 [Halobacteriales archaeon SW_8_66_22]